MSQILRAPIFNIFNLLNRKQKKVSDKVLSGVKKYEKKEWKFIFPAHSEERVSKWPELMTACSTGDVAKVNALLQGEDEIDVNQQDDKGVTPLLLASRGGHAEIVQQLLSKGAQVDAQSKKGKTALMKACKYGNLDVVKFLLVGNVNLCSNTGVTALMYASLYAQALALLKQLEISFKGETVTMWASSMEHVKVAKLLLNHDAQVNMQSYEGLTALMCASIVGHTELVKLLLDHGAEVNMHASDDDFMVTALTLACMVGQTKVIKLLLDSGAQVNMHDNNGFTALMLVSVVGHIEVAKLLLDHGAQVNMHSINGTTALMGASNYGQTEVAKLFLDSGAQVNMRSNEGMSALMCASGSGHTEVAKLLIDRGAQVNMHNNEGETALMAASRNGRTEVAQLLLDHGAQVNMHSNEGETALMSASGNGHTKVAKLLLDCGAQVNMHNNKGITALMDASDGHTEVVQLLLDHGAQVNMHTNEGETALMFASVHGHTEVANLLLDHGAQVNKHSNKGFTALIFASSLGHTEVTKLLLNHGAHINMQSNDGVTALMSTSLTEYTETVQLLLDSGAEVNMFDNGGKTALIYASKRGHATVVKLLLSNGAELEVQSEKGETPLMLACLSGSIETVKLILDSEDNNIDAQDIEGQSALLKASYANDINLINLLLNNGAELDLQQGISELTVSISHKNSEAVLSLLEHGANVNITDINGCTPLTLATQFGLLQEILKYLIFYGADLNLQDSGGKSALIHAVCNGHRDITTQLIELGAEIDLQDNDGWSALMYAVNSGDLKSVQCLLSHGANVRLRNSDNCSIFDVCSRLAHEPIFQELFQSLLSSANNYLEIEISYRGIIFSRNSVTEQLSSSALTINYLQDLGISVSVPENSLGSPEESVELCICPCFTGPFELQDQYESASPAYLIRHDKTNFQKDITIRMHHYASLQSEEDCEDMAFLTASSTPEYRGSHPVYTFKEIPGTKGVFRPGDQVGQISLRHFCLNKIGKKKSKENQRLYSARLYRNVEHKGEVSAIFCICLFSPIYMKHCDKVINEYTGMSAKGEGMTEVYARIVGEVVEVYCIKTHGLIVSFDQKPTEILKRDVHIPELMDVDVSELVGYPPRLLIYVKQTEYSSSVTPPEVQVIGLDRECSFAIPFFECVHAPSKKLSPTSAKSDDKDGQEAQPRNRETEQTRGAATIKCIHEDALGLDDLGDVLDAVETLSAQWRILSTKLRLKESSLDTIERNYPTDVQTCLYKALGEWLRLNYDHQRHGKPSWKKLSEAVKSLDHRLFEKLVKERLS